MDAQSRKDAVLLLEDGTVFYGKSAGAIGTTSGGAIRIYTTVSSRGYVEADGAVAIPVGDDEVADARPLR